MWCWKHNPCIWIFHSWLLWCPFVWFRSVFPCLCFWKSFDRTTDADFEFFSFFYLTRPDAHHLSFIRADFLRVQQTRPLHSLAAGIRVIPFRMTKDQSPFRAISFFSPWKNCSVRAQPNQKISGVEFKWENRQTTACAAQVSNICLLNPPKWWGFHPQCSSSHCFNRQMVVKC